MREAFGITLTAITVIFGGAGTANATALSAPVLSSSTTTLADDTNNTGNKKQHSDKSLRGLAGLLGLVGLAGLKRRNNTELVGSAPRSTTP